MKSKLHLAERQMKVLTDRIIGSVGPLTLEELTALTLMPKKEILEQANQASLTPYEWTLIQCATYWMNTMNHETSTFTQTEQLVSYVGSDGGSEKVRTAKIVLDKAQEHLTFEDFYPRLAPLLLQSEAARLISKLEDEEERKGQYTKILAQIAIHTSPDYYRWLFDAQKDFGFTWDAMQEYLTK